MQILSAALLDKTIIWQWHKDSPNKYDPIHIDQNKEDRKEEDHNKYYKDEENTHKINQMF